MGTNGQKLVKELMTGKRMASIESFSKKCNICCHKGYTDKNEKQVGCYMC